MPESIDWPPPHTPRLPGRRRRRFFIILAVLAAVFFGGRTALSYYVDVLLSLIHIFSIVLPQNCSGEGNLGGIGNPAERCRLRRHGSVPQRYIPEKKPDDLVVSQFVAGVERELIERTSSGRLVTMGRNLSTALSRKLGYEH